MLGYLSAYKDKYKMCIISKDHLVTVELLDNKYDVAEICFNRIIFYPSEYSIVLTEVEVLDVQKLENYDVIEINSTGIYYRLFSDIERDTAIVTTSRCNSNCLMCPASDNSRSNAYDVPLENIKKLISYLPKNLYYLTVTGGEPTLIGIESFIEVMKSIKNKFNSTKVLLLTNGRTMGNIKFFKEFLNVIIPGMRVAIPIHGYDPQTHDKITQVHGSFNQSIRGIHHLLSTGIEVEIRIIVSKLNADFLVEIAKYIIIHFSGICIVNFVGLEMRGNCVKNREDVILSYEESFQKSKEAIKLLIYKGIDVGLYNFPFCLIDNEYWPIVRKSIATYKAKYYSACETCQVKEACPGIFEATMKFYKPVIFPIIDGDENC